MILIHSGTYVIPEFQGEVGKIPPCMLPVGNQKLLEHQCKALKQQFVNEPIYLTLPDQYELTINEKYLLKQLAVNVVWIPDYFSLGEALHYALDTILLEDKLVRVLFGNILIQQFPALLSKDVIGLSDTGDQPFQTYEPDATVNAQWSGYFSFSNKASLVRALAITHGNFIQALQLYQEQQLVQKVKIKQHYDFGHINTYFKARSLMTTQRAFNSIEIDKSVLKKTGLPAIKIEAEAAWFANLPVNLRAFVPQLLCTVKNEHENYYALEYLPYLPLNELFVHARNPPQFWQDVFKLLLEFLGECRKSVLTIAQQQKIKFAMRALYQEKTLRRLQEFGQQQTLNLTLPRYYKHQLLPSIFDIAEECITLTVNQPIAYAVMHGDLCLSNILHDSRLNRIKVLDPRGITEAGELSIYGDQKYDIAKLAHSILGLYDFIIAGRYRLVEHGTNNFELHFDMDQRISRIQTAFKQSCLKQMNVNGVSTLDSIMPLTILLFLSMLPLHQDRPDRQKALLVNALRLYHDYILDKKSLEVSA